MKKVLRLTRWEYLSTTGRGLTQCNGVTVGESGNASGPNVPVGPVRASRTYEKWHRAGRGRHFLGFLFFVFRPFNFR